jgi:hypothetical protein
MCRVRKEKINKSLSRTSGFSGCPFVFLLEVLFQAEGSGEFPAAESRDTLLEFRLSDVDDLFRLDLPRMSLIRWTSTMTFRIAT